MPQLSERVISITGLDGDGWEIFNLAREMKISGAEIIELTIGEHDDSTHSIILKDFHKKSAQYLERLDKALDEDIPALINQQQGMSCRDALPGRFQPELEANVASFAFWYASSW